MNEAETRAEHVDPALAAAGWGVVEGSRRVARTTCPSCPGRDSDERLGTAWGDSVRCSQAAVRTDASCGCAARRTKQVVRATRRATAASFRCHGGVCRPSCRFATSTSELSWTPARVCNKSFPLTRKHPLTIAAQSLSLPMAHPRAAGYACALISASE
jgi:hypothetical protein